MKYVYSVAEHSFVVTRSAECLLWRGEIATAYADFELASADESNLLFHLQVEYGEIVPPVAPFQYVAQVPASDFVFEMWRNADGDYVMVVALEGDAPCAVLYANQKFSQTKLVMAAGARNEDAIINNAIMLCYAFAGAYRETLLFHASVPHIGDTAFLFQGRSGTGKSTHSQLWLEHIPHTALLNDDNPVVRIAADGQVQVWGTPWSGKTPCYRNVCCSLGGALRLQQAGENSISRLKDIEAFASLLASCSAMMWDKAMYAAICATVEKIVAQVPAYQLRCLPNREAAELSYHTLSRKNGA